MLKKLGFSLIELMIYLSLGLLLSTTLFSCFIFFQRFTIQQAITYEKTIRNLLALDLLRKDIMSASPNIDDWKENNTFLVKKLNKNNKIEEAFVSWQIKKNQLQRIERTKQRASFLGTSITSVSITPKINNTYVEGARITYTLRNKKQKEVLYVRLRSRIL